MKISCLGTTRSFIRVFLLLSFSCAAGQTAPVPVVQTANSVHRIAFSPDSKSIAVIDERGNTPEVWDIETGHKLLALHRAQFPIKAVNSLGQVYETVSGAPQWNEALGFAPDGRHLAAIPEIPDPARPPSVWDLRTGEAVGPWNRSSSGQLTLAGTKWSDDDVRAWHFGQRRKPAPAFAKANAISADGSLAAISTGAKDTLAVQVWDVDANRMLVSIPVSNKNNTSLATFSADKSMLAIVIGHGSEIWQLKPLAKLTTVAPDVWAHGIRFSPDGHYFVVFGTTELRAVRVGTWETVLKYNSPAGEAQTSITDVVFSLDNHYVAASDGGLRTWDLQSGRQKMALDTAGPRRISALSVNPDGSTMAIALGATRSGIYAERNSRIEFWPLMGAGPPHIFTTNLDYSVQSMAFSHDSQWLGAACQQSSTTGRYTSTLIGEVRLWHVADGMETKLELKDRNAMVEEWSASNVAFSRDDKQLVADVFTLGDLPARDCDPDAPCGDPETLQYDVRATFFKIATGQEVNSTRLGGAESSLWVPRRSFWLSPDGRRAFALDPKLTYIDTLTGRKVQSFKPPTNAPAPTPGGPDNCGPGLEASGFVAFVKDMQRVAISDGQSFMVLDSHTGASKTKDPIFFFETAASTGYEALTSTFSSDGRTLAISTCSGSQGDGELRLYRSATLELESKVHMDLPVTSIVFTPDGSFLFTGGYDGTLQLWKTQNGALAATLVGRADGEWIIFTPDGLYDASTKGAALLAWRMHGNLVMAADLPKMRVSGLLSKILSGTALRAESEGERRRELH